MFGYLSEDSQHYKKQDQKDPQPRFGHERPSLNKQINYNLAAPPSKWQKERPGKRAAGRALTTTAHC
jgi:hypothetical protein